jgi:hypothetical protein
MDVVITLLIFAALGVLLYRHIKKSKETVRDDFDDGAEFPPGPKDKGSPPRSEA